MSALAKFMLSVGKRVGGSDRVQSVYTRELEAMGAAVEFGEKRGSIDKYDVIIYTDAILQNDVQLKEAESLKKIIVSRGEFLYLISRKFKKVIAVSGCHGKTTCASMLTHIFFASGKPFAAHIGGRDLTFKNAYFGGNDYFITEACEYKKNFLYLKPDIAVVLNYGADHLECYGSAENLRAAYIDFMSGAEECISRSGEFAVGGIKFGTDDKADFYARNITCNGGKYSFEICRNGKILGEIKLNVFGLHNIWNALAAVSAACAAGLEFSDIKRGIERFSGVERRFEEIGDFNGAKCIADYAHHPDEIEATLKTAGNIAGKKLYVVFQPHTYSRTKNLFSQFVSVLLTIENLLIYKTFAAREYFDDSGSALTLYQNVENAKYGDCPEDMREFLSCAGEGDAVLFLGAGDIYEIAKALLS